MDRGLVARMEMKDLECSVPAPALWADSYFLLQLTPLLPLAWCPGLLLSGASSLPGSTLCSLCDKVRSQSPQGLGSFGVLSGLDRGLLLARMTGNELRSLVRADVQKEC